MEDSNKPTSNDLDWTPEQKKFLEEYKEKLRPILKKKIKARMLSEMVRDMEECIEKLQKGNLSPQELEEIKSKIVTFLKLKT